MICLSKSTAYKHVVHSNRTAPQLVRVYQLLENYETIWFPSIDALNICCFTNYCHLCYNSNNIRTSVYTRGSGDDY